MKKFWLVWRENGGSPTKMHDTANKALEEADRLASKETGTKFYILQADICVSAKAVLITENMDEVGV